MPTEKLDSLKVDINTQTGYRYSETVVIYLLLFQVGSPEALLKFVKIIHKIIRGQDLSTGPQTFGMTLNLGIGGALRLLEQKSWEKG